MKFLIFFLSICAILNGQSQQFPLTTRSMVALQRADPLDRDESIALVMDEERYKEDASVMQPESGRQRELLGQSQYSVDISYLVADLKYSQEFGIKICEVQHGALSSLKGDIYSYGKDKNICSKIANFFSQFSTKKWAASIGFAPLVKTLSSKEWTTDKKFPAILNDPEFLAYASIPPIDENTIESYFALFYCPKNIFKQYSDYHFKYPGIIFIDAATLPFWIDKYKMSLLFNQNETLRRLKPEWGLYKKEYSSDLAKKIQEEISSDIYVIKPRGAFLGNGIIITSKEDLDTNLQMILKPTSIKLSDKAYSYWHSHSDDSFIVEKFYPSDPLILPYKPGQQNGETEVHTYDATMRIAFILTYEKETMAFHPMGGYWALPCKSLEEGGTLNATRKACCKLPFYAPVDPDLIEEVTTKLEEGMLLLYREMLTASPDCGS